MDVFNIYSLIFKIVKLRIHSGRATGCTYMRLIKIV